MLLWEVIVYPNNQNESLSSLGHHPSTSSMFLVSTGVSSHQNMRDSRYYFRKDRVLTWVVRPISSLPLPVLCFLLGHWLPLSSHLKIPCSLLTRCWLLKTRAACVGNRRHFFRVFVSFLSLDSDFVFVFEVKSCCVASALNIRLASNS